MGNPAAPRTSPIKPVSSGALAGDLIGPDHPLFGVIWINRERLSGEPCFYGTRVPIKNLFDALAAGETVESFLADFDGVTREQADTVLEMAGSHLLAELPRP